MKSSFSFSIIVPAYNEEKELPRTLKAIDEMINRFQKVENGFVEVIVVDNRSTDSTAQVAEKLGATVVTEEKRQIARARNCGARFAKGEILVFCDADTTLHPQTLVEISTLMQDRDFMGGGIKIIPDEMNWKNRLGLFLWNIFSNLFQISGGNIFCRREHFDTIGGFPERFFMGEDVRFQLKMKREAFRRRKKSSLLPGSPATSSMRKLREYGFWRYGWSIVRCLFFPWLATQKEYCSLWYEVRKNR